MKTAERAPYLVTVDLLGVKRILSEHDNAAAAIAARDAIAARGLVDARVLELRSTQPAPRATR